MRKLLVVAMALLMAVVFSGCDNQSVQKPASLGKYIGEIHMSGYRIITVYEHEGNLIYIYPGSGIFVIPKGAAR